MLKLGKLRGLVSHCVHKIRVRSGEPTTRHSDSLEGLRKWNFGLLTGHKHWRNAQELINKLFLVFFFLEGGIVSSA